MKECGTLGFVLALAVTPRNLLLWGGLLIACVGMYIAGERAEGTKKTPDRAVTRPDAGAVKTPKP
nr:MAG TPA: hypothetical protein [Caudoviricetes sp.]